MVAWFALQGDDFKMKILNALLLTIAGAACLIAIVFYFRWRDVKADLAIAIADAAKVHTHSAAAPNLDLQKIPSSDVKASLNIRGDKSMIESAINTRFLNLKDREEKIQYRNVNNKYRYLFAALKLSNEEKYEIQRLLVEREMIIKDGRDAAQKEHSKQAPAAIEGAQAELDKEIQKKVTPSQFELMQMMFKAQPYVQQVQSTYAADMAIAGVPVDDETLLRLGYMSYQIRDIHANPKAPTLGEPIANVELGLTESDLKMLDSARTLLSPAQVSILQNDLIEERSMLRSRGLRQ